MSSTSIQPTPTIEQYRDLLLTHTPLYADVISIIAGMTQQPALPYKLEMDNMNVEFVERGYSNKIDMKWEGRFTSGMSWGRGSSIGLKLPDGRVHFPYEFGDDQYEPMEESYHDIRADSVAAILSKVQSSSSFQTVEEVLDIMDQYHTQHPWEYDHDRDRYKEWLEKEIKDAPNPWFFVEWDGQIDIYLIRDYDGLVDELECLVRLVDEFNVTQEWI